MRGLGACAARGASNAPTKRLASTAATAARNEQGSETRWSEDERMAQFKDYA
jgi:hypothetical protein